MNIMRSVFLHCLAVFLLPLPSVYSQDAVPGESAAVRINYFSNSQAIQVNLSHFEAARRSSATLESSEVLSTYRSGGAFIVAMPKGLSPETLRSLNASFKKTAEIDLVENATTVLITYPPGNDDFTGMVLAQYAARTLGPDESRAELKKGFLLRAPLPDGGYIEAVSDRETIPPGDWFKTLAVDSRILLKDRRVEGKSFGKVFGGSGLIYDMATRGYMDGADLNIAWINYQVNNMSFETVLELLRETKTDIYPLSPYDLPVLERAAGKLAWREDGVPEFICSNVEFSSAAPGGLLKKYAVREVNGVKLGIFFVLDNKNLPGVMGPSKAELSDPARTAGEIVRTLRETEKVDTVIMLTAFFPEDLQAALAKMPAADIVINAVRGSYYAVTRNERVELENWGEESVSPALVTGLHQGRLGKLRLGYSANKGKLRLVSAEQGSAGLPFAEKKRNKYDDQEDSGFLMNVSSGPGVLPDSARLLSADKQNYAPLEIFNLAATLLNEKTTAEVTLLKLSPFNLNVTGPVSEGVLRTWLKHKKIFTADIDGASLRSLMKQVDFDLAAVDGSNPWEKYSKGNWLAAAGLTQDGRIAAMNINGNEKYRVSVTEDLLARTGDFPGLARLRNKTDTGLYLDDVVAAALLRLKDDRAGGADKKAGGTGVAPVNGYEDRLRGYMAGAPAARWRWRLNVEEAALQFSETRVSNTQAFSQVPNSKLQAIDQLYLQGALKLALEARRDTFWDDTKVSLDYGKIILRPDGQAKIVSETADRMLFENELRYAAYKWDRFGGAILGPLVSVGYNTEFTAEAGIPKRRIAVGKAGVKVFEGSVIQDFYTAAVMERDFTYPDVYTKWAWETGTHVGGLLGPRGPEYAVDISYKQFSPNRLRLTDLKREFEVSAKLKIRLFSDLSLAPFMDYYAAKGMVNGAVAHNYIFGVALDYSRLFKLRN